VTLIKIEYMRGKVTRETIAELLKQIFETEFVNIQSTNRYDVGTPRGGRVFVSQSQPSRTSKGHWKYEFFHTITEKVIEEIMDGSGRLVLINYVDRLFVDLNSSDICWCIRHSSRIKGKNLEQVTDFVVERVGQEYRLRPYDRFSNLRRKVSVERF
tara:strand:+ start:314 stop:781 length:468 start_codon:yes stop_codon:yes gene_type:complete